MTPRPGSPRNRAGFTIIELLVVAVVGALLVVGIYETLIKNQQAFTQRSAHIASKRTVQAGAAIIAGELREVSMQGGDILVAASDSMVIRVMRAFGMVCDIDYSGNPDATIHVIGSMPDASDSLYLLADNDIDISTDDAWLRGTYTRTDTTTQCSAATGDVLRSAKLNLSNLSSAMATDSVRVGAVFRSFDTYTLGLYVNSGDTYLGWKYGTEAAVPLVGPLKASGGLSFVYLDDLGSVTAVLADIARVDVTLSATPGVIGRDGSPIETSITISIAARN